MTALGTDNRRVILEVFQQEFEKLGHNESLSIKLRFNGAVGGHKTNPPHYEMVIEDNRGCWGDWEKRKDSLF